MDPSRTTSSFLLLLISLTLSCADTETLIRREQQNAVLEKGACTQDSQCPKGRCVGGICSSNDCQSDADCRPSQVCQEGICVDVASLACKKDQRPLVQLNHNIIDFGSTPLFETEKKILSINNVGDCPLKVSDLKLENDTDGGFTCEECKISATQFIAPAHSLELRLGYTAKTPGSHSAKLLFKTNDTSVGNDGAMQVALNASYAGEPKLFAEPAQLYFNSVLYAKQTEPLARKTMRFSNRGSGNSVVTIESISLRKSTAFSLVEESYPLPRWLPVYTPHNAKAILDINVAFSPNDVGVFSDELVLGAKNYLSQQSFEAIIPIRAESKGGPRLRVSSQDLLFRTSNNEPVAIGSLVSKELTLFNDGQTDLIISDLNISPLAPDFSFFPIQLAPIPPGKSATLNVFYAPTVVGMTKNSTQLIIATNDPSFPLATTTLRGFVKNTLEEVLTVEMNFSSAQAGWASSDFRDVDLELISPTGFSCAKPKAVYSPAGDLVRLRDYCEEWNTWGREGHARWIAPGELERPERVNLFEFGANASPDQVFTVRVHYVEDCSSMPTGILASALGVGVSALSGLLGKKIGSDVLSISPSRISDAIASNCVSHSPTLATVKIQINGREISAPQVQLFKRGDSADIVKIRRNAGHFEVIR